MSDIAKAFDALIEQAKTKHGCRVHAVIEQIRSEHGDDVAAKFEELAGSRAYSMNSVLTVLREHGYRLGKDAVTAHRKRGATGGCDCA